MRSPYRQNAFFLLNTTADTSLKELLKLQLRIEVQLEMGETLGTSLLPFLPQGRPSREDVLSAIQRLQEGRSRIREELFWVHAGAKGSGLPPTPASLGKLISYLKELSQGAGQNALIARHNLAAIFHALAFEQELGKTAPVSMRRETWTEAHLLWRSTFQNPDFWEFLSERVASWEDPTVADGDIQEVRRALGVDLLQIHQNFALEYTRDGKEDAARLHIEIISAASKWLVSAQAVLSHIASDYVRQLRQSLDQIVSGVSEETLRDKAKDDQVTMLGKAENALFSLAEKAQANLRLMNASEELKDSFGDHLTGALRILSVRQFNVLGSISDSLRLLDAAIKYARTESSKASIHSDHGYLEYQALCKSAVDLGEQHKYGKALENLEVALRLAPEDEQEKIKEWMATCKRNRILDGVDTNSNSPTLYTLNGIGATFYGKRDFDPGSNSYVTTHLFTVFFIPIGPLAAYRVISAGSNSYNILGKVPLFKGAIWYRRVVLVGIALFILVSIVSSSENQQSSNSNSSNQYHQPTNALPTQQDQPPAYSPPASSNAGARDFERQELDRIRQELAIHKNQLETQSQRLDSLASQIQGLKQEIKNLEDEYPGSSMPDFVYRDYQDKLDRHNRLVRTHNQLLLDFQAEAQQHDRDVDQFNRRVAQYKATR